MGASHPCHAGDAARRATTLLERSSILLQLPATSYLNTKCTHTLAVCPPVVALQLCHRRPQLLAVTQQHPPSAALQHLQGCVERGSGLGKGKRWEAVRLVGCTSADQQLLNLSLPQTSRSAQ